MPAIPVGPQCITPAWLSDVLEADVLGCDVEQIAIGVGLLGRLFRVRLKGGPDLPPSVVVKLPTLDQQARTALCEDLEFYLREVRFYREIGRANPLPPARPYYAAIDEATHDFVLVLEDLQHLRKADQTTGCALTDAESVIDGIARHHAHWWDNARLRSLPWLKTYSTPEFARIVIGNYEAGWPVAIDRVGSGLSPALRSFGERLPALMPWLLAEFARPPMTFLHGDLRLDQLFFAVTADDPPVTALDWQITATGRGAYDVAYFITQSLATDDRRACEDRLVERYAVRLAEHGIDYPAEELRRDYRLTTASCFLYPIIAAGRIDVANDRQLELLGAMLERAATAVEDHDCLALRPD
ncbi:oxidoreductase family protein [Mycobacterium sp. NPDC050041]|uniref:oxidoreductase family protein n=1 Tax=Mycobacterium sp. NPDC050041 TaxID=3364293 RepID=UPI003C2DE48A